MGSRTQHHFWGILAKNACPQFTHKEAQTAIRTR